MLCSRSIAAILSAFIAGTVAAVPYEEYILAPSSRTLHPVSIVTTNGTVSGAESIAGDQVGSATFQPYSAVAYDFGKNIAGLVSLTVGSSSATNGLGVTFTESSLWITNWYCDATADAGRDEAMFFDVTGSGTYTLAPQYQRGAFRYLTVLNNGSSPVEVTQISVNFTAMPHWADDELKNYTGYFHCNDELLNRIWYAGAYTNQLCTIEPDHGDALVHLGVINSTEDLSYPVSWYNNYTITNGSSCLVDGAKRDRLVWPGDMSISVPGTFVSTNDLVTDYNSLASLFVLQSPDGMLPYAGVPFFLIYSATYHMYSLIGVADIYTYTDDLDFLTGIWDQYKAGLNFSLSFIDSSGLMNVTSSADWLRFGMGGHNIEANSILYYTINQAITLATILSDTAVIPAWQSYADGIKTAANNLLWNATAGLYRDNETTSFNPQDGNCWAIVSNITDSPEQIQSISSNLISRWGPYGAPAPEAGATVSPFISGFELQAHILASNASAALDLMRLEWGFMLNDPRMTNSTFIEGFSTDGSLHYAPYTNDPRVSHAHGWATGPTSVLTFGIAGLQITSAGGKTWRIEPGLGDLTEVEAGFAAPVGEFKVKAEVDKKGDVEVWFVTPEGTTGSVSLLAPSCEGTLVLEEKKGQKISKGCGKGQGSEKVNVDNVPGGTWTAKYMCS